MKTFDNRVKHSSRIVIYWQDVANNLPINVCLWLYYTLIVLPWDAYFPSTSKGTNSMYFTKQYYESIVPENSVMNRFIHDTDLFSGIINIFFIMTIMKCKTSSLKIAMRHQCLSSTHCDWRHKFLRDVTLSSKKGQCPAPGYYRFIAPAWLTNGFPKIYHVMSLCRLVQEELTLVDFAW